MSGKGAVKSGNPDPGHKNKNRAMAAYMAKMGIRRTTFRCPITNNIIKMGQYPGMKGKGISAD